MRTTVNRLFTEQYYVQQWLNKEKKTEIQAEDLNIKEQPLNKNEFKRMEFKKEAIPHIDFLLNYALNISKDRNDAFDLFQNTYLLAFRFFHKFERGTDCKKWLFRIMKNCYINKYREDKEKPVMVDFNEVQNSYIPV